MDYYDDSPEEKIRRIIRDEIQKDTIEKMEMKKYQEFIEKIDKRDKDSGKFVTYIKGEKIEGPRKKIVTKPKSKRKICSCKNK